MKLQDTVNLCRKKKINCTFVTIFEFYNKNSTAVRIGRITVYVSRINNAAKVRTDTKFSHILCLTIRPHLVPKSPGEPRASNTTGPVCSSM